MTPLEKAQQRIDEWIQQGDVTQPLDLSYLGLTTLPELPSTLRQLYCGGNQLTSLPSLPPTLQGFYYNNNPLTIQPNWQQGQPQEPKPEPLSEEEVTLCIEIALTANDLCPILHEPLQRNACSVTPCRHVFSASGLAEWRQKPNGGECPMCRQRI